MLSKTLFLRFPPPPKGHYTLKGQALSFLPVTGDGDFGIDLSGCSLSAISFLHLDKDEKTGEERLVIKELEVSVDYAQVKFDFKVGHISIHYGISCCGEELFVFGRI